MSHQAFGSDSRQSSDPYHRCDPRIIIREAQPAHAGIDLKMNQGIFAQPLRGSRQFPGITLFIYHGANIMLNHLLSEFAGYIA